MIDAHNEDEGMNVANSGPISADNFLSDRPTMTRRSSVPVGKTAWLFCERGMTKGQLFQLSKLRIEFGKSEDCDIAIVDEFASEHHGALICDEEHWKIIDFASTNGTFVNGKQLIVDIENPTMLRDGDRLEIGDTEYVFKQT